MKRSVKIGLLFQALGVVFLFIAFICFAIVYPTHKEFWDKYFILAIILSAASTPLFYLGVRAYNHGRRLRVRLAQEVLVRG
jgi:Kef-type K+ transport system membrane component KefB